MEKCQHMEWVFITNFIDCDNTPELEPEPRLNSKIIQKENIHKIATCVCVYVCQILFSKLVRFFEKNHSVTSQSVVTSMKKKKNL